MNPLYLDISFTHVLVFLGLLIQRKEQEFLSLSCKEQEFLFSVIKGISSVGKFFLLSFSSIPVKYCFA